MLLLCGLLVLLAPAAARAADGPEVKQAREHFRAGETAFKAGRYQDAYREWEAGFALSPRALFLLNMAHAERRRGELGNARTLYRRYLLMEPETKLRGEVEAVLREIDETLGPAPAPAASEAPATPPETSTPLVLPPVVDNPSLAPPPVPPSPVVNLTEDAGPAPEHRPVYKTWWFWTAVGGTAVVGVLGWSLLRGRDSYASNGSLGTIGMGR